MVKSIVLHRRTKVSSVIEELGKRSQDPSVDIRITDVDWDQDQINEFLNFVDANNINIVYDYRGSAKLVFNMMVRNCIKKQTPPVTNLSNLEQPILIG